MLQNTVYLGFIGTLIVNCAMMQTTEISEYQHLSCLCNNAITAVRLSKTSDKMQRMVEQTGNAVVIIVFGTIMHKRHFLNAPKMQNIKNASFQGYWIIY